MKHFTAELYQQLQADNPPEVIEQAMADWDRATAAYENELQQDWQRFPQQVQWFLDSIRLHDAEVLADDSTASGDTYRIVLRTEGPAGEFVELVYSLREPPVVLPSKFSEGCRSSPASWMYDEISADPAPGEAPTISHRVLLSDGRELRLRFHDMEVHRFSPLVSANAVDAGALA